MAISYQRKLGDGTIVIDSNTSNVGIGTNDPASRLHVTGTGSGTFRAESTSSDYPIRISGHQTTADAYIGVDQSNKLKFYVNSGDRMVIISSGNVGIGTTSPSQTFTVEKNSGIFRINTSTSTYPRIEIGSSSGTTAAIFNRTTASQNIIFGESSDTGNYIFRGGNVGIGTTSPSEKLEVSGNIQVNGNNILFDEGTNDQFNPFRRC